MDFDDLRREGREPAIVPNAGRGQTVNWTSADAQRFLESLRAAFPHIFVHEDFSHLHHKAEKPVVRTLDRIDSPAKRLRVEVLFTYPGWQPNLIRVDDHDPGYSPYWTWERYVSPRLSFSVRRDEDYVWRPVWKQEGRASPIESWASTDLMTSYRRELPEERKIEEKALRLARKVCERTVPMLWHSLEDYFTGKGRVNRGGFMVGDGWTVPSVIDWCRAAPNRMIDAGTFAVGGGTGCLPVELVPDAWWGDIPKPKWAQRP
jgi:hypothetical protein